MTDEIPMDSEQLRMRQKFWLCAELWTDVFTLLSRQQLVRSIQPVHRRFKAICDKYVPSIHLIINANAFLDRLAQFEPVACRQYEDLKGNDCELATQFRLYYYRVNICKDPLYVDQTEFERRRRMQQCVMRNCLDLFQGCGVHMSIYSQISVPPFDARESLTILKPAEPAYIKLTSRARSTYPNGRIPSLQMDELFREPTILHCTQLILTRSQVAMDEPSVMAIYEWLHHCSKEAEMTKPAPAVKEEEKNVNNMKMKEQEKNLEQYKAFRQVRCLYIHHQNMENNMEELQYRCVQHLHQSQWPRDRRLFLFNFRHKQTLPEFQVENEGTGELIRLENVKTHWGHQTTNYCLFRCLAEELEGQNGQKFYEKYLDGIGLPIPKMKPLGPQVRIV